MVHHINQKFVTKNPESNWSAMLLLPSIPSGSSIRRSSVRISFSLSPNSGASIPSSITCEPGMGRGLDGLVPFKDLFRDRLALIERGDRREQVVRTEILTFNHASAAQHVSLLGRSSPVKTTPNAVKLFENRDVVARKICVPDEECGSGERSDATPDEIYLRSGRVSFVRWMTSVELHRRGTFLLDRRLRHENQLSGPESRREFHHTPTGRMRQI